MSANSIGPYVGAIERGERNVTLSMRALASETAGELAVPPSSCAGARNCTEQPDQMQKNPKLRWSFGANSVQ